MLESHKVALVTVTFNSEKFIEKFLSSLNDQDISGALIIVDSDSKDNTGFLIETWRYKLTKWDIFYLNQENNLGVAACNNLGILHAINLGSETIVLVNNDVEFSALCLSSLVEHCLTTGTIAVPIIYYGDERDRIWFSGGEISRWRGLSPHQVSGVRSDISRSNYAPTCCMVVPTRVFNEVGLMDEKYFMYFDDSDFCVRLQTHNIPIYLVRKAVLFHYISSSSGGSNSLVQVYFGTRNRLYFISKNLSPLSRVISILYFFITRLIKLLSYLFVGDRKRFFVTIKAIIDYFQGRMGKGTFID